MANSLKSIPVIQIANSPTYTSVYTVPASTKFTVSMVHLCNTTASPVTVRVCLVELAGTPSSQNAILWNFSIPANDVLEIFKGDILDSGTSIQACASAGTAINIKVSGIETT